MPVWRTNQIVHFPIESLLTRRNESLSATNGQHWELQHHSVCKPRYQRQPLFCNDVWINFRRTCNQNDNTARNCQDVGILWVDIMRKVMAVQLRFPSLDVDLTLLSSAEDEQVCKGGLAFIGRRRADVSSIIRHTHTCETVFIEDHRYEVNLFTTNGTEFFRIVSVLRTIGQTYFYSRIAMLFASCYATRAAEERYARASRWRRLRAAVHLFARIPSQCVVFGSPIPICCYAIAHFIDAPNTYEMVAQSFTTPMGKYVFDASKFAYLAANQMRNVWFLAIVLQLQHWLFLRLRQWSAPRGILGVPEFLLGLLSCLSMVSQLRLLSLRDSRILSLQRVVGVTGGSVHKFSLGYATEGNMLLEGVLLDAKFFLCLLPTLGAIVGAAHAYEWYRDRSSKCQRPSVLMPRMAVPYTAGIWWSTSAFTVSWGGTIFPMPKAYKLMLEALKSTRHLATAVGVRRPRLVVSPLVSDAQTHWPRDPLQRGQLFQQEMEHIHARSRDIDSLAGLINLVALSDPVVFLRVRVWRGYTVHYFRHPDTGKMFAVPAAVVANLRANDDIPWEKFVHIHSCNTRNMLWSDLIHVG
ncbi:TPA: hypothetical protein N0F65_001090 [Lagenidium giganteum]|uniref:Uncharacterized protein n=1 Tax=Lagenidium giganteum TaxID=4803 RepID=A0AAV2YJ15_9STRA|nr:TPA: hypothetical protein N0F65_011499 [Lagenidium giganteum]DAZ93955.1 TPA: hypothetical protein N0F65_001090 [Lagenidium giganteum]